MPTRVAVILEQLLSPVPGGTGRYSAALAKSLAETATGGAEVQGWVAAHRDVSPARLPGVLGPRRLTAGRRVLARLWERGFGPAPEGCDLVHAPTVLAPPRGRAPLVVTVHDAVPWTHPETLTPHGVQWHRRLIERAARFADIVVVSTHAATAELEHAVPALRGRCEVIPPGVSGNLALPADADERVQSLRLPADGYLLSVATLEPRKGLDVLVQALAKPQAPNLPLLVAGQPGWGGVDLAQACRQAGLSADRVRVLGYVSDQDLAVLYSKATALVAPSRSEGFGLPVLEAMAAGLPVVASDLPVLVEVGGAALVTAAPGNPDELANALARVVGDPQLRKHLATSGLARASAYSWERSARRLWELYGRLA